MSGEEFLPDIYNPPHYQVIFKVSHIFRSLLNPNILHSKTLIGMFKFMHNYDLSLDFLSDYFYFIWSTAARYRYKFLPKKMVSVVFVEAIVSVFTFA